MTWRDAAAIAVILFAAAGLLANPILLWHTNRLVDKYEAFTHEEEDSA